MEEALFGVSIKALALSRRLEGRSIAIHFPCLDVPCVPGDPVDAVMEAGSKYVNGEVRANLLE